MSLRLDEYVDPVAELFMELDLEELPVKDVQRKLCEAGVPAGRALQVKAALKTRTAAPPTVPVSVCACVCLSGFTPSCGHVARRLMQQLRKRAAKLRLPQRYHPRSCGLFVCVCAAPVSARSTGMLVCVCVMTA
jgi:hypothetical protein